MTIKSLSLLIDSGLLTSSGSIVDLSRLPEKEISNRLSQYINGRIQTAKSEIDDFEIEDKLNALFSTGSSNISKNKLLSSSLVYSSMIIDDPLVSSATSISVDRLEEGLKLFSWAFDLVKSGFIKIVPISFFNRPTDSIPIIHSDDAFRSDIPHEIYDFIHENAIVKSVIRDKSGGMFVLRENADVTRRTALNISFRDDFWRSGVSLYLFQTLENCKENGDGELVWEIEGRLDKEKFDNWAYQCINRAMRSRLIDIYNESHLAEITGHTYVTESSFESKFMSMAGISDSATKSTSAQFLEANDSFIYISSPRNVIELRTKYAGAFERFNYSLLSISDELSGLESHEFEIKSKRLFVTEIQPQIDEIRSSVSSICSTGIKGGFISLCGLAAAVSTGSTVPLVTGLIAVAAGLSEALPEVSKLQKKKKGPAYIWHRVTKT